MRATIPDTASAGHALALALALVGLAACGPDPAAVDRSPVAGMTEENPGAAVVEDGEARPGSRNHGELTMGGPEPLAGVARVTCAPAAGGDSEHPVAGLRVAFTPLDAAGTEAVLDAPAFTGDGDYEAAVRVERVGSDGRTRLSEGTARLTAEVGDLLASSAATHWVSGRFEGRVAGEAGAGEVAGSFGRCYYFE